MKIQKKHIKILLLIFAVILGMIAANLALAQTPDIYPKVYLPEGDADSKITYLTRLPGGDWRILLSEAIRMILAITGSLTLIAFTVGGVIMITGQGNEEKISKGKNILLWSVVALVIIAASYAIVLGITQLALIE